MQDLELLVCVLVLSEYIIKQKKRAGIFLVLNFVSSPHLAFWAGIAINVTVSFCYFTLSLFIWENLLLDNVWSSPGPILNYGIFSHCSKLSISDQEQNELVEEDLKFKISKAHLSQTVKKKSHCFREYLFMMFLFLFPLLQILCFFVSED